ncbi:hypothetical protein CGZ80_02000 [Rhodopirellula sp. MGV]|nr:hypothetical protein CGZ80_02000 [Rhodopirellula sp. MGV]PNY34815.1 hypothetical protein C2E31_21445 [Rhodopirellula baltica]
MILLSSIKSAEQLALVNGVCFGSLAASLLLVRNYRSDLGDLVANASTFYATRNESLPQLRSDPTDDRFAS